jgi:aminoglycoside 3-N-acetyltransferase
MNTLLDYIRPTPLRPGDTVLLHSSLRALGPLGKSADAIIDAFLNCLTPAGTLAVPTHTWATVTDQQPVFHQTFSPSTVGTLTNVLRLRPEAVRSLHPSHSVAAIGSRAAELTADHELDTTPCSPASPYGKLITWKGKVALLGVDLARCTFIHCVEELANHDPDGLLTPVPKPRYLFRHDHSLFLAHCRSHTGDTSKHFPRVESQLIESGALTVHPFGPALLRILDAARTAEVLIPLLRSDPKLFL